MKCNNHRTTTKMDGLKCWEGTMICMAHSKPISVSIPNISSDPHSKSIWVPDLPVKTKKSGGVKPGAPGFKTLCNRSETIPETRSTTRLDRVGFKKWNPERFRNPEISEKSHHSGSTIRQVPDFFRKITTRSSSAELGAPKVWRKKDIDTTAPRVNVNWWKTSYTHALQFLCSIVIKHCRPQTCLPQSCFTVPEPSPCPPHPHRNQKSRKSEIWKR